MRIRRVQVFHRFTTNGPARDGGFIKIIWNDATVRIWLILIAVIGVDDK